MATLLSIRSAWQVVAGAAITTVAALSVLFGQQPAYAGPVATTNGAGVNCSITNSAGETLWFYPGDDSSGYGYGWGYRWPSDGSGWWMPCCDGMTFDNDGGMGHITCDGVTYSIADILSYFGFMSSNMDSTQ